MVVNWLCPCSWAGVRSPPGACAILPCAREHFPLVLCLLGQGHSRLILTAPVKSDTGAGANPCHWPGCRNYIPPGSGSITRAGESSSPVWHKPQSLNSARCWAAQQLPVRRKQQMERSTSATCSPRCASCVSKKASAKAPQGWSCSCCSVTGTNTQWLRWWPHFLSGFSWFHTWGLLYEPHLTVLTSSSVTHLQPLFRWETPETGRGFPGKQSGVFGINCTEVNNNQNPVNCYSKLVIGTR